MREINYHILKQQIEHSNSDEKTENSISSALKKGKELIDTVSKSGNTELAQKFKKEYQELYNRIKRALEEETENEGKDTFSKLENLKIMIELGDLEKLQKDYGISISEDWVSWLGDKVNGTSSNVEEFKSLQNKNIEEYTKQEAQAILEETQKRHQKFSKGLYDYISTDTNTLGEINSLGSINNFQEKLIDKVYGESTYKKGYSSENIIGYSTEKGGNYIISKTDVEREFNSQGVYEWNSLAVANYFKHISASGNNTIEYITSLISPEKLASLQSIWSEENRITPKIAKNILIQNPSTRWIIEGVENLDINELLERDFTTINNICSTAEQMKNSKNTQGKIQEKIKKDPASLQKFENEDVSDSCDTLQEPIVDMRKNDFEKKVHTQKEKFIQDIGPRFQNNKNILTIIESTFDDALDKEKEIDMGEIIQNINEEIEKHNQAPENQNNLIEKINNEAWRSMLTNILSLRTVNLKIEYTKTLNYLGQKFQELSTTQKQLEQATIERKKAEEKKREQEQLVRDAKNAKEKREMQAKAKQAEKEFAEAKEKEEQIQQRQEQQQKDIKKVNSKLKKLNSLSFNTKKQQVVLNTMINKGVKITTKNTQQTLESPEVKNQLQNIEAKHIEKEKKLNDISLALEKGDIQVASEKVQELQQEDNNFYATNEYEKVLQQMEESYENTMQSLYGENWKEQIPSNKDINTDREKENAGTSKSKITTGTDGTPRMSITVQGETKEISITPEEAKLAQNNEKVQENIINFYTFFKQLNMEGVWKYRKELITAMGTVYINLEDDSLKEAELIKFGNNIAKIINGLQNDIQINTQSPSRKLLEAELRKFSESGNFLAEEKTFNYLSEGKFTALMRSKGIIGGVTFKTKKIQELMQKGT